MNVTRKSPRSAKAVLSALAAIAVAGVQPVSAAIINFDQNVIPVQGTISFDGGGIGLGTVTASGIMFDRILSSDTPLNDGSPLICVGCTLTFTTGVLSQITPVAGGTQYTFGAGGSVTLTGQILAAPGVPAAYPGTIGDILVTGTGIFSFARLTINDDGTFFFAGRGTDEKITPLVEYYIGPNDPPLQFTHSNTELGGTGLVGAGGSFTCADPGAGGCLTLADFSNTVPEPATTLLVLLGLGGLVVRRFRY
jgi:hypothetical protein